MSFCIAFDLNDLDTILETYMAKPLQLGCVSIYIYILWIWPPHSNSDHQDYEPFLVGDPNLNFHLPLLL